MTFEPIISAPPTVQFHVLCAMTAVVLGPVALLRRSRDMWHRRAGYVWVMAMLGTAISSFWISDAPLIGPFSPIHGLSVFTIYGLWQGITAARKGDIKTHRANMQNLYFWAMGVAGAFTFLPGRRMNTMFFADHPIIGFFTMLVVIGAGLSAFVITQRRTSI